jgi:hypothetical protein
VYLSVLRIYARQIDLGLECDLGRYIRVVGAAVNLDAVDTILVDALVYGVNVLLIEKIIQAHTCGGPRIVPFQSDMRRSSPLSRPYEHASTNS